MFGHTVARAVGRREQRRPTRLDSAAVRRLFPASQLAQWPSGYLPACGVAHFLHPEGVALADVIDCYRDMKADKRCELQRDFATDYTMWCRATLWDFVQRLSDKERRRMRRLTDRHRAVHDAEARGLLGLPERAVPHSASQAMPGVGVGKHYDFTPYAATQEYAMLPVSSCDGPGARLHLTTFPQIRNIMHTEFDSMGPARALSLLTGDELLPTTELVQELAFYLRRRVEEIRAGEGAFRRTAVEQGGAAAAGGFEVPFSVETPVVCFFGNGRLAWLLNNSGLLPFPVVPVGSPAHAAARERRQRHLLARDGFVAELSGSGVIGGGFSTVFPCESISVLDAMRKYRPCLVVVEPHTDRDWLCDLRGFYTTREVLLLGPVDSPAMCSFAFPFLSFGVTPGPTTYWIYNDMLQRAAVADRIRMPMDPPHVSQGYARHAVDNISSYLLSPNDCCAFSNQYRCISFVRKVYPVIKGCAGEGSPGTFVEAGPPR